MRPAATPPSRTGPSPVRGAGMSVVARRAVSLAAYGSRIEGHPSDYQSLQPTARRVNEVRVGVQSNGRREA
jgi:hypothetical protein